MFDSLLRPTMLYHIIFLHCNGLCVCQSLLLQNLHRESKMGATLTMAITLSILDRFAKFFHWCKQQ